MHVDMETEPSQMYYIIDVVREHCFSCCDLLEQLQYMKTHVHVYNNYISEGSVSISTCNWS